MIDTETALKRVFERGSVHLFRATKGSYNGASQLNYDDSIIIADAYEDMIDADDENVLNIMSRISRVYEVNTGLIDKMLRARGKLGHMHMLVFDKLFGILPESMSGIDITDVMSDKSISSNMDFYREIFGTEESFNRFKKFVHAPAAKKHHGNFIHGLIVHSMTLYDIVNFMEFVYAGSLSYPINGMDAIDWDAIRLMSMIHDFYKIDEYVWETYGNIDSSDMDTTYSHSMRMFAFLESIKKDENTSEWTGFIHKLQQMSLLHHGQWSEWTIGKRDTLFPETEIFHSMDLIDSRVASAIEK
jgi:hypothetical protein